MTADTASTGTRVRDLRVHEPIGEDSRCVRRGPTILEALMKLNICDGLH